MFFDFFLAMFPNAILSFRVASEPNLALALCSLQDDSGEIAGVNLMYHYPLSAEPKRMKPEVARDLFGIKLLQTEGKHQLEIKPLPEVLTLHNGKTLTYPFRSKGKHGMVQYLEIDISATHDVVVKVIGDFKRSAHDAPMRLVDTIRAPDDFVRAVRLWLEDSSKK